MLFTAVVFALSVQSALLEGLHYREIGPAISGGRSTAVTGSNRNPLLYFAGGAGGGVFKSTDGGASWEAVFDREPAAPVGAIALNPNDDRDLWVGTGESNPRNDVESGNGIYRTRDGGKHWSFVGLGRSAHISAISIDPRNPRSVVAGVLGRVSADDPNRGVYVTRDGGLQWTRTLYVGPSSGVSSLVRVPGHPSTLFAGIWQVRRVPWNLRSGGPAGGIYRSDDGGSTWRRLSGNGLPSGLTGRIGLAPGARGRLYAVVQSSEGDLWRSDDGGTRWRLMPHSPYVGARPFYFSSVYADPANPDRLIVVGLIMAMSTDGGATFHTIADGAGWDYHAIWWSADGRRVINGNDEGVILSADGGERYWQPYDLPFAQPYHVGLGTARLDYRICVGLQDDNSWCGASSPFNGIGVTNRNWMQIAPGDGMWAVIDPRDPNLVWSTSTNNDTGQVYLWNPATHQSEDVSPDAESNGSKPASALRYRFNWDAPIAFTISGDALVGGNVVFESGDHGKTWSVISPDLTRNDRSKQGPSGGPIRDDQSGAEFYDTILYLATTPLDPHLAWAGTDDGLVQIARDVSGNGAANWQNVAPPATLVPPWGRVSCIEPGRFAAGTAFVAVERHLNGDEQPYVLRTDDYGATWHSIAGDLPRDQFVRSIRQDPNNPAVLYAGSNRGVWVTFDAGTHWQSLRSNMPATAIYDLEIQTAANDLVVGSHGRGVWILDDLTPIQRWSSLDGASPALFPLRDAFQMWNWAPVNTFTDPKIPPNEYVGRAAPDGALVTYYLPRSAKHVGLDVLDANGRVISRVRDDLATSAGVHRATWDLSEEGPVKWQGTYEENRGPDEGAEVVPGTYTVRLSLDGSTQSESLTVRADPRETMQLGFDAAAYQKRHDFLANLFKELGAIDTMLNAIDARRKNATGDEAVRLASLRGRLTYDPRNVEDLSGPAQLREDLLDLVTRMSTSFAAPNAAQEAQAAIYERLFLQLETDARGLNIKV